MRANAVRVLRAGAREIMAPDAATCAIVASVVLPLAGSDTGRYVSLSMTPAVLTGVFCMAAGLARLGFITSGRPNAETIPGLILYRFGVSLLFFNSDHFRSRVKAVVDAAETPPRWFVLDAGTMPMIDSTGAAVLGEVRDELGRRGIELVLAEAKAPVRAMLERTGLDRQLGSDRMFPTIETAVAAITSST